MRKKKRTTRQQLTEEAQRIISDISIPPDMAGFMLGMESTEVSKYRSREKYREGNARASANYRKKLKEKHLETFGRNNACYGYWSKEEVEYIMNTKEPDTAIAEQLGRTVYSIQKKRERELKKQKINKGGK